MVEDAPERRESLDDVKHGEKGEVRDLSDIPPEEPKALLGQALKDQIAQKRGYGRWMLIVMAVQLLIADGIFVTVAWAGYGWRISDSVMHVWLVGTFVQIISVVAIIVRSLFSGADVEAAAGLADGDGD